jgi:hypothetical protein
MARHGFEDLPAELLGGLQAPRLAMLLRQRDSLRERQGLLRLGGARSL